MPDSGVLFIQFLLQTNKLVFYCPNLDKPAVPVNVNQPFLPAPAKIDKASVRTGRVSAAILMLRFRFSVNLSILYTNTYKL